MPLKTDTLELPAGIDRMVAALAKVLLNDVKRIVMDVDNGSMEIRWSPMFEEDELDGQPDSYDVKDVMEKIRITESEPLTPGSLDFLRADALKVLANEMQLMAMERRYGVGWVCSRPDIVKRWLGLPELAPMPALMGLPVYTIEGYPSSLLFLMGSKFFGAGFKSVVSLRQIRMPVLGELT